MTLYTTTAPFFSHNLYCVHVHLSHLFPLITFVINMMYLQIIYQHKAIQIPKMIKQKVLQLVCKQVRYGFSKKFSIYFLWSIIFVLTNYLQLLLYISYEQSDACHYKGFPSSNYKAKVSMNMYSARSNSNSRPVAPCVANR